MPSDTLSPLPLMELATGFWSFKTLASAYELGLFEQLSGTSGTTAGELADRLGIASRPAEMLLTGCAALGLLQNQDGRYVNSPVSDEYLVPGKPNHFGGLVTMFDRRLYTGWDKLTQAIRTNRPTTWDPDHQRSMFENWLAILLAVGNGVLGVIADRWLAVAIAAAVATLAHPCARQGADLP